VDPRVRNLLKPNPHFVIRLGNFNEIGLTRLKRIEERAVSAPG
jgi:hypothetical protein